MNRPFRIIGKTVLAGVLSTGACLYAGTAASGPVPVGVGPQSTSDSLLYAQQYYNRDKPPYVRPSGYTRPGDKQQLEKSDFARLEEKPGSAGYAQKDKYRHVPGQKPPYVRNP